MEVMLVFYDMCNFNSHVVAAYGTCRQYSIGTPARITDFTPQFARADVLFAIGDDAHPQRAGVGRLPNQMTKRPLLKLAL